MCNCRRRPTGYPSRVDGSTITSGKLNLSYGGFRRRINASYRPFRLVVAVLLLLGAATFLVPAQADGADGGATENLQGEGVLEDTDLSIVDASSGGVTRAVTSGTGSADYFSRSDRFNVSGTRAEVEEGEDIVEFTLVNASGLQEIYFVYEPEGWESARTFKGIEEGISVTLRTEASAERLLESEEVLIPDGLDLGFNGFGEVEGREATEIEEVTCLYDHNGYSFLGVEVPAEIDIPCHAPSYRDSEYIDEGTGTPISLKEGEYRFIGKIDGEEAVILSHTVDNVNTSTSSTEGTGADRTEEDSGRETNETREADGEENERERDADGFLGMAAVSLIGLFAILAFSLFGAKRLNKKERDGSGDEPTKEKDLLSSEEHVLRELERNNGRMKQQTLVESLDWTEAKTSRTVNKMHDEESIDKYRLGRENVIALPEDEKEISEESSYTD